MNVTLARRVAFSSGHRYWNPELSPGQNHGVFGATASPYNHGHNYTLWVSCRGPVDPDTGMVVNIKLIDDLLQRKVVAAFDQRSINDEVDGMAGVPPTVENLLAHLSRELADLPHPAELVGLRLDEHPLFFGEWSPDGMITLTRSYEFAASHRLHVPHLSEEQNLALFGKCNNPAGHGHNYVVEVTVSGQPDAASGMLCDLDALDRVVHNLVVDRYDHRCLDADIEEFRGRNTTSETVALEIFRRLDGNLPARLERVRLYETARNMFEVTRDSF